MKIFFSIFTAIIFSTTLLSFNVTAQEKSDFSIESIKVRIYDYKNDKIIEKPTNPYGNDMNIFLSVLLKHDADNEDSYEINVEGFGKGRENEAEGKVEDHKTSNSKKATIYVKESRYIPFVMDFPCVDETTYKITVTQKSTGKKIEKSVKTKLGSCYLN